MGPLVIGVMNIRAMAFVAAVITIERRASEGERVARVIGFVAAETGVALIAQAAGLDRPIFCA